MHQEGAQFQIEVPEGSVATLGESVLRLAQACIRVSDIAFTGTHRGVSAFREQVEDFIEEKQLSYEPDYTLVGAKGNEVRIDFRVESLSRPSLVQTLSAGNEVSARHQADNVFTKWYDIREHGEQHQFMTVVDSSVDVLKLFDLRRILDFSEVIRFPSHQETLY